MDKVYVVEIGSKGQEMTASSVYVAHLNGDEIGSYSAKDWNCEFADKLIAKYGYDLQAVYQGGNLDGYEAL